MRSLGNVLVILQMLGIGWVCYAALHAPYTYKGRLVFVVAGLILGLITLRYNRPGNFAIHPEPKVQSNLITSGPYHWIRHPMYLSVILVTLGIALYAAGGWLGMLMASGAVIVKAFMEERMLKEKFPEYADYQKRTKMVIPFIL